MSGPGDRGADTARACRVNAQWWFNEIGMPMHLGCGHVGRYEARDGRHYVVCPGCDVRKRVPAPSLPYWHMMHRKAS